MSAEKLVMMQEAYLKGGYEDDRGEAIHRKRAIPGAHTYATLLEQRQAAKRDFKNGAEDLLTSSGRLIRGSFRLAMGVGKFISTTRIARPRFIQLDGSLKNSRVPKDQQK